MDIPQRHSMKIFGQKIEKTKTEQIKFTWKDKLFGLKAYLCCRMKRSKSEELFQKGQERIYNEMNLFTICQTLQKLKASVSVIVAKDDQKFKQIQDVYYQNARI